MSRPLIYSSCLSAMINHAREQKPLECCGLLSGRALIERATPVENVLHSPTLFEMSPRELIAFMKRLRQGTHRFLGIYHSHPKGPPVPSRRDFDRLYYREVSYWIVTPDWPQRPVRCYRWSKLGFVEMPFEVCEHPTKPGSVGPTMEKVSR